MERSFRCLPLSPGAACTVDQEQIFRVIIRDVAREAGVSIQTVSNVLNSRHGVALATRQRVREAIQQLGYQPSDAARSLRSGRLRTVGLLIGYDDLEIGRLYDPPLSTIAQPKYQLGFRGVTLLLDQVEAMARDPEARPPEPLIEQLDCELIARRSSLGCDDEIRCGSIQQLDCWRICLDAAPARSGPAAT